VDERGSPIKGPSVKRPFDEAKLCNEPRVDLTLFPMKLHHQIRRLIITSQINSLFGVQYACSELLHGNFQV
jgi:hypothetical protein